LTRAEAFDGLNQSLEKAWQKLKGESAINKENVKEPLRDIRRALLEADVSLPVVRRFVKRVEEKAIGTDVTVGLKPDQQLVKVVSDELIGLMGTEASPLAERGFGTTVVLMAGLQGVGKTTMCGKLASYLQSQGKSVTMVACDVYRPAAVDQLQTLGERVGCPVFSLPDSKDPSDIAKQGVKAARDAKADYVIVDTAGRLAIDEDMMQELRDVRKAVKPDETLLVVDAMTGQEAARVVQSFDESVELTGAILTKLDGDSRGGAALSVYEVSGKPIKFVGVGEKLTDLEQFYPDRMAGRILGMGDVLTLVERTEAAVEEKDAERLMKRMMSNEFDFNDFLEQSKMMAGLGSMSSVMKMLPGMSGITNDQMRETEKNLKRFEAMIASMTEAERTSPDVLVRSPSRRARIARGSGHTENEVSAMVATFGGMRKRMRSLVNMMGGNASAGMTPEEMQEEMMARSSVSPGKVRRRKKKATTAGARGFG